jgi:hypothetical protein
MAYFASFALESVTVKYTSGEDGEYTFRVSSIQTIILFALLKMLPMVVFGKILVT